MEWFDCPLKNVFARELVPPILPGKTLDYEHLISKLDSYLCTNCCNFRLLRTSKTAPGCIDVYEIRSHSEKLDVDAPPKEMHQRWHNYHSFRCYCGQAALLCESDKFSDFNYTKAVDQYDPESSFH